MSTEQNRRDFIGRSFRLGGLFAAFGSWNAWNLANSFHEKSTEAAPVPSRLLISEADEVIDTFIKARGAASAYYCQMFFPTFIMGNEISQVALLAESTEKKMALTAPIHRPRLRVLPAVAAAHMLPLANDSDARMLRDVFLASHKASFDMGAPCRVALGNIWSCMTAVVVRNRLNWQKMLVGPDIVKAAQDVCLEFLSDDNATLPLLHTAASSWQFLLTYKKALAARATEAAVNESRSVSSAISRVQNNKGSRYVWLDRFDRLYEHINDYDDMLPEYFELVIGRSNTKPGSQERDAADFCVLLRMYTTYLNHLIAEEKLKSPFLFDVNLALELNKRSFAFLVDFGVSPPDWKSLRPQAGRLLPNDAVKYFDSVFENFDEAAGWAGAGGEEARYAGWYSKHVPFRKCLPEESAAAAAYCEPQAREAALEALRQPEDLNARLAFCLPALAYGCNLEGNSEIAKSRIHASVEEVKKAALTVLETSRYAMAFEQLSKSRSRLPGAFIEQDTVPARLSLAGVGGDQPLRGKETVDKSGHQTDNGNPEDDTVKKTPAKQDTVPLQLQWKPRLGFYRHKKALLFSTDEEFSALLRLFWEDDNLFGLPRNHAGGRLIVVPAEAVTCIRNRGFHFREIEVLSSGSLPPEKESRLRKEQGMK